MSAQFGTSAIPTSFESTGDNANDARLLAALGVGKDDVAFYLWQKMRAEGDTRDQGEIYGHTLSLASKAAGEVTEMQEIARAHVLGHELCGLRAVISKFRTGISSRVIDAVIESVS